MINQLFFTKYESNMPAFIVFVALNAILLFILLQIIDEPGSMTDPLESYTFITLWLLIFLLVAGGISLLRHNREKRNRLYAQLPVTPLQIRVAYWFHASLYLFISTLVLTFIMVDAGITSFWNTLGFACLYLFHAGVLLAAISITTSNTMRLIPEEVRKHTIVYFILVVLLTFLILFVIGFITSFYVRVAEGAEINWNLLTLLMLLLCVALVSLDVRLFVKKDSYLG